MNETLIGVVAIAVAFLFLFYVNKWDLVDMTGLAKKRAIQGMPLLAKSLSMKFKSGDTKLHQGELSLKTKQYKLTIFPDHNRISVHFNQPLGIYLLSGKDPRNSDRPKDLKEISFSASPLNTFFLEHLATNKAEKENRFNNPDVELALTQFIDTWAGRKFSSFALRNDILHITFAYSDYLPLALMETATPQVIALANALSHSDRVNK